MEITGKLKTESMAAVGYVRVSTEGQAIDGVSLDAQRTRVEGWCTTNGFTLVALHIDAGVSGKRADTRPGLQKALEEACRRRAALVVYSLSRLARSTKDALTISDRLDRAGGDLVSLSERIDTTTAAGKMVFRMLAVLAEFERDLVSERTAVAMAHLRSQGKRISGKLPYGYMLANDGVTLVEAPHENRVIVEMSQWKAKGVSLNGIARILNDHNVPAKHGGQWSAKTVRDVLRRATQ
jgi:DNA invertase Pin-like site-specific DNA recombinase